jgi:hypothetical protein
MRCAAPSGCTGERVAGERVAGERVAGERVAVHKVYRYEKCWLYSVAYALICSKSKSHVKMIVEGLGQLRTPELSSFFRTSSRSCLFLFRTTPKNPTSSDFLPPFLLWKDVRFPPHTPHHHPSPPPKKAVTCDTFPVNCIFSTENALVISPGTSLPELLLFAPRTRIAPGRDARCCGGGGGSSSSSVAVEQRWHLGYECAYARHPIVMLVRAKLGVNPFTVR